MISLTGDDSIIFNGVPLTDFGDGDVVTIEPSADVQATKVGKNGNAISARNVEGDLMDVVIKLLRGSDDDIMMNDLFANYFADPASFQAAVVSATKRIGDGSGFVTPDTQTLIFGLPKRRVGMKENVSGDTDQALAVYAWTFISQPNNSNRTIG